tara:strand:+ start:504 stop:1403 length:900 start_codon:yes stop_codon:yes gene_type:complete
MTYDPTGLIVGTAVNLGLSLFGGSRQAAAAREQAELQNEASRRKWGYDVDLWEMEKQRLLSNRQQAVDEVELKAANEFRTAQWQDAVNLQQYNNDMMIRNREQASLNQQFYRSDNIYDKQITLNAASANTAAGNELRKLEEIKAEAAFDKQEQTIERLKDEGKLRARGMSGRSAAKLGQATLADYGRQIAMLDESLSSAGRNARAVFEEIAQDKASADLAAYAQKMLDPGVLPEPIVPFTTPMAEWIYPREIGEFDFGPQPVLGAMASPTAAASQVWGTTISGIAGTVGSAFTSYINKQ